MKLKQALYLGAAAAALALVAIAPTQLRAQQSAAVAIDSDDIGGVVTGPSGPEAGVWVIAETNDLADQVRQDRGHRRPGPLRGPRPSEGQLHRVGARLWAGGFAQGGGHAGQAREFDRDAGAEPAAAAEYYPGMYWYSMLKIPAASEFPGTGAKGNGIPPFVKTQGAWIDTVKNSCQSCHALGSKGIRTLSPKLGTFKNSREAWERRLQSGQAMSNMAISIARIGPDKAVELYADWTDRIAAGELPSSKPERPQGIERNVVITMWDWGTKGMYLHDAHRERQVRPDRQRQRPDLRIAGGKLRPGAGDRSRQEHVHDHQASLSRPADAFDQDQHGRTFGVLGRRGGLGQPHQHPQSDDRRRRPGVVHGEDQARGKPGVLQEGLGPPVGEARATRHLRAPALVLRSQDPEVGAHQHLLLHPAPQLRP